MHRSMCRFRLGVLLLVAMCLTGCSPSLSPLYRDYEVRDTLAEAASLQARISKALQEAGWERTASAAPNAVATEARSINNWGLYKVVVSLEVVPVGDQYVRLFVHPYRVYITGGRSKIPYLSGALRRDVLPGLNAAFSDQGLEIIGTPMQRDEEKQVAADG